MYSIFYFLLLILFFICNVFVLSSKNPVHSILFLILSFLLSSIVLFLFKIDFLAFLYIIIYVGALAILFLFVIMMLNAKHALFNFNNIYFLLFFFIFIFLTNIYLYFNHIFSNFSINFFDTLLITDFYFNINSFSQIFFNYYIFVVLIAGLILLLALLSSISLTIKQTKII